MHARGFRPIAKADARVLVLGTLPGTMSLAMSQYYAQPRNAFWPIMGALFGALPALAYRKRLKLLTKNRVALWDVCHSAYREGALDASIDAKSIVPNDFATFFRSHRHIQLVCFNGQTARKLYRRLVLPGLPAQVQQVPQLTLPSTSPAHAAMRFEQKLEQWGIVRRAFEA
ncbi:MAG: DNA-deoxyinosine glycosylase [Steroidobacteraceae bacterium]|nr:DNA-deoxyinosine glycosylase [Steroidobacteraceae bacterium]